MTDEERNDDLTQEEEEIREDTGTTGEVAHRVGEFRDLRDRLERLQTGQDELKDALDRMARILATRAVETDEGNDMVNESVEDIEEYTDPRERDYSMN